MPPSLRDALCRLGRITRPVQPPDRVTDQPSPSPPPVAVPVTPDSEVLMPINESLMTAHVAAINGLLEKSPYVLTLAPPGLSGAIVPAGATQAVVTSYNNLLARTTISKRVQVTARPGVPQPGSGGTVPGVGATLSNGPYVTGGTLTATLTGIPAGATADWGSGSPVSLSAGGSTISKSYGSVGNYTLRILDSAGNPLASRPITVGNPSIGITYEPPITITTGGSYTTPRQSTDPDVPAIIIDTDAPVVIETTALRGKGDLIRCRRGGNVTIRNVTGQGLNPDVAGRFQGRFADLQFLRYALVENNDITGTAGVYFNGYNGTGSQTFTVRYNRARDINGQFSDGQGGYRPGDADFYRVQFVQFNNVQNIPGSVIEWNWVTNTPRASHVEDTINIGHGSSGKSDTDRIKVRNNLIDGAFAWNPAGSYSGGGIILGDGGGQYMDAISNIVLEASNYGIAVADGNYLSILQNLVLGAGKLPDGTYLDAESDAGIYVRDYDTSTPRIASSVLVDGNTVGWGVPSANNANARNDIYVQPGMGTLGTNTLEPDGPITEARKQQGRDLFAQRVSAAGVTIGRTS